jgi:hypothetical protein
MKTSISYISSILVIATLASCASIKKSRFSKHNQFTYEKEQPKFNFRNDSLKVEGKWYWASANRVIPKLKYLPKTPTRILEEYVVKHGPVLFATWGPNRTKFSVEGEVPVTKKDVRFKDKNNLPFYIMVLLNEQPFKADTAKYEWRGRNNDYQFGIYTSKPELTKDNYWIMEVVADGGDLYYDFLCIMDKSFMSNDETGKQQADLFMEDIKLHFLTQE